MTSWGLSKYNETKLQTTCFHLILSFSKKQQEVWNYNPGQNIWNKIEKSSKTGQDKKSLISTFAYFSTATAKV